MNKKMTGFFTRLFTDKKLSFLPRSYNNKSNRHPILLVWALLVFFQANAQREGVVRYRQILNLDTTAVSRDTVGVSAFLYFEDSCSLYVYNRSDDMPASRSIADQLKDGAIQITYTEKDLYGNMLYKDFSGSRLFIRQLIWGKAYRTHEPLPLLRWTITPESRHIGKFTCYKALVRFRGRDYEAWFCPDIPVRNGPWKFHGLPGLIMDIYDSEKEIRMFIEMLRIPSAAGNALIKPPNGKYIPFEMFRHIEKRETEKIVRFLESIPERGSDASVKFSYYPIEKDYE